MKNKLIFLFTGLFLAFFAHYVAKVLPYPYDLHPTEGHSLHAMIRLFEGQKVYGGDSFLVYPPVFFLLGLPFMLLFSPHLWMLRGVSVIAALGMAYLLKRWIHEETGRHDLAWLGVGLLFTTKIFSGYFVIARVDTLLAFFVFATLYLAYRFYKGEKIKGCLLWLIAGSLLAGYTKQAAVFLCVSVFVSMWQLMGMKTALQYGFNLTWMAILIFLGIEIYTDGGFSFSVISLLSNQQTVGYIVIALLGMLAVVTTVIALFLLSQWSTLVELWKKPIGSLLTFLAIMMVGTLFLTFNTGAGFNYYLPLWAPMIVMWMVVWNEFSKKKSNKGWKPVWIGALTLQMVVGAWYGSDSFLLFPTPTEEAYSQAGTFETLIEANEGPILIQNFDMFNVRAGRGAMLNPVGVGFLVVAGVWPIDQLVEDIENQIYGVIAAPSTEDGQIFFVPQVDQAIKKYYLRQADDSLFYVYEIPYSLNLHYQVFTRGPE